jgi:hypothetical protein
MGVGVDNNMTTFDNGTWLEAEEKAYPNGTYTRLARCICPDGKLRVVLCSIPDTYFSIPAKMRIGKTTVKGWIGKEDYGLVFHKNK